MKKTRDALAIIDRIIGDDPDLRKMIAEEEVKLKIAREVLDARDSAGLTQSQLAKLLGVHAAAIKELEEAEYKGNALELMQRIAEALHRRMDVRFLPQRKPRRKADSNRKNMSQKVHPGGIEL